MADRHHISDARQWERCSPECQEGADNLWHLAQLPPHCFCDLCHTLLLYGLLRTAAMPSVLTAEQLMD